MYLNYQIDFLKDEKPFGKFLNATKAMSPEESAEYLKTDESITNAHQESAQEGQTEVLHFRFIYINI
jgi:hypothetical protein